jgi:hypothetical protein
MIQRAVSDTYAPFIQMSMTEMGTPTQLCTERPAVAMSVLDDLHPALVAGMACCTPSARRNRLRCVGAVIGLMGAQQEGGSQATREKVSAFVSEIVLGVKEVRCSYQC